MRSGDAIDSCLKLLRMSISCGVGKDVSAWEIVCGVMGPVDNEAYFKINN